MYAVVAALLIAYRVVEPLVSLARHRFEVVGTVSEGPGVTSVYVSGRNLARLDARAGQFFMWRFLTRKGWWQAHPFSLSAAPDGRWLRLTAKSLGDHSGGLAALRPGTKVLAEGPTGPSPSANGGGASSSSSVPGVGVTPLRAMFESVVAPPGASAFIYRARSGEEIVLGRELDEIAARRQAPVHYLVGPTDQHPEYLSSAHIAQLVPDVGERDVFVCGPPGFMTRVTTALSVLGVPSAEVHTESFEL